MRVLGKGDVLNYQKVVSKPELLGRYDLAFVELTPATHGLPQLIRRKLPDLVCFGVIEGRVEYVVRSRQEMEGLFQFFRVISTLDMVGVLVERTIPYYRLYSDTPERVQWIGVPYPKDWTDTVYTPDPLCRDLVIEVGSALDSRNGIANLLVLRALQKEFPQIKGRIYYCSPRELGMLKELNLCAETLQPRRWPDYYRTLASVFALVCMDDRRTWGRYALDCAAARVPFIGSDLSHCGQNVGVLTMDPFDTDKAIEHLGALIEERLRGKSSMYAEVVEKQYVALGSYDSSAALRRLAGALVAGGQETLARKVMGIHAASAARSRTRYVTEVD